MNIFLRFAHLPILIVLLPGIALLVWYRLRYYKRVYYRHSLVGLFKSQGVGAGHLRTKLFLFVRIVVLIILAALIAKPQLVDVRSKVPVDGIDIMLVLDVSGSMQCFDDLKDRRSRIEVAKQEAKRFINKRNNDAIGLVLFGNDAVSRVPLTMDKKLLSQIVDDITLGVIDERGTVLATGMAMAVNRLRSSSAKSKIMIVLTDGQPSKNDIDSRDAIDLARQFGIKIYTVGVGNEEGGYIIHPYFRQAMRVAATLNKPLLQGIARRTGGQFFEAKKPDDIKRIYNEIDRLEKTEHEATIYYNYQDFFLPLLWFAFALMLIELIFTLIWFGL